MGTAPGAGQGGGSGWPTVRASLPVPPAPGAAWCQAGWDARRAIGEIARAAWSGRVRAGVRAVAGLPAGLPAGLRDDIEDRDQNSDDDVTSQVGEWLAAGGVDRVAARGPNLADGELYQRVLDRTVRAFNRRAAELATPTVTSRRKAAAMKAEIEREIAVGGLPWTVDRWDGIDGDLRSEIVGEVRLGGIDGVDLDTPVELAAVKEVDEWLRSREVPPKPRANAESRAVAAAVRDEFAKFESGKPYPWRRVPASFAEVPPEDQDRLIDAARGSTGQEARGGLRPDDIAVVTDIDRWLAERIPPGRAEDDVAFFLRDELVRMADAGIPLPQFFVVDSLYGMTEDEADRLIAVGKAAAGVDPAEPLRTRRTAVRRPAPVAKVAA